MKKKYIKPLVLAVELNMRTTLLVGSKDTEGMGEKLYDEEEVDSGF